MKDQIKHAVFLRYSPDISDDWEVSPLNYKFATQEVLCQCNGVPLESLLHKTYFWRSQTEFIMAEPEVMKNNEQRTQRREAADFYQHSKDSILHAKQDSRITMDQYPLVRFSFFLFSNWSLKSLSVGCMFGQWVGE